MLVCLPKTGLEKLVNLKTLYCSNNKLRDWAEVERLRGLPALEELLLAGNPLHTDYKDKGALAEYRLEVWRHVVQHLLQILYKTRESLGERFCMMRRP